MVLDAPATPRAMYSAQKMERNSLKASAMDDVGYVVRVAADRPSDPSVQLRTLLPKFAAMSLSLDSIGITFNLSHVHITPPVLALVVELLSRPFASHHRGDASKKWSTVQLDHCFFQEPSFPNDSVSDEGYCTFNEIQRLISTISSRASELVLFGSPEIINSVTRPLEVEDLVIEDGSILHSSVYAKIGEIVQASPCLQTLELTLHFYEAPNEMFESFASAIHLQVLDLRLSQSSNTNDSVPSPPSPILPTVVQLLQNPLSQLKHLCLSVMGLEDSDFIVIVQALPASKIEYLNVNGNHIHCRGLMEFAHQLPRIQSLKTIEILNQVNWWTEPKDEYEAFCVALVEGMKGNHSLENLDDMDKKWVEGSIISPPYGYTNCHNAPLLIHYATLNRAGRRILSSSLPVPLGLWPLILERAMKVFKYETFFSVNSGSSIQANAVFFLVQHCLQPSFPGPMDNPPRNEATRLHIHRVKKSRLCLGTASHDP